MNVPEHLGHLRRDRRELPVPYVNAWGPEKEELLFIQHDIHVNHRAVFREEEPHAEPDFTRQDMGRQRRCIALGLCQVCGEDTGWPKLAIVGVDQRKAIMGDAVWLMIGEPFLCPPCAEFALTACPALIRRRLASEVSLVIVDGQHQFTRDLSTGYVDGPLEAETRADPVAMWGSIMLPAGQPA